MIDTSNPLKLWAFYHNPMTYESADYIVSYHKTKKGATLAMKKHKAEARKEFDDMYKGDNLGNIRFGSFEAWFVERLELVILD